MRRTARRFLCVTLAAVGLLCGCASPPSPAVGAMQFRQAFNGALQTVHELHQQGKLTARQEQRLLPAILAGSAALDQMDADAAAGDQAGFDVALTAAQAALAQIQSISRPATPSSTRPASQPSR